MRDFWENFGRLLRDRGRDRDRRVTWTAFAILAMFYVISIKQNMSKQMRNVVFAPSFLNSVLLPAAGKHDIEL